MAAKIKVEISVGLTDAIKSALEMAAEFTGTTPSQYGRQAILEKVVREGFLQRPYPSGLNNSQINSDVAKTAGN